jgi:hypothetical protein
MFSRSLLWSALLALSFPHIVHRMTVHAVPLQRRDGSNGVEAIRRATDRQSATTTKRGVDIPITRRAPRRGDALGHGKRAEDVTGSVGLGDHSDLLYTVPIEYENTGVTIAVNIAAGCYGDRCDGPTTSFHQFTCFIPFLHVRLHNTQN